MARFIPHVVTFDLSPSYNCCSHRKSLSECAGTVLQNSAGTQTQIHTLMLPYWWALTQRSDLVETQPERKWFPVIKTVFNLIVLFFFYFSFHFMFLLVWGHDWDIRLEKDGYVVRKPFGWKAKIPAESAEWNPRASLYIKWKQGADSGGLNCIYHTVVLSGTLRLSCCNGKIPNWDCVSTQQG